MAKKSAAAPKAASGTPGTPGPGTLVIVESPTKAKTIEKILGPGYIVKASFGHVRDLPKGEIGVDVQNGFRPTWRMLPEKVDKVKDIKALAQRAGDVVLATDLDREGESIAWDLAELLDLDLQKAQRVVFHEVTPQAIGEAFRQRRPLNKDLVEAQRARRILDRLIGYEVSPLLGRKIQWGLSAGRVQSVALRLVVEREREIRKFVPEEYWSITADLAPTRKLEDRFRAKLHSKNGKTIPARSITNAAEADALVAALKSATYSIEDITEKPREKNAPPPFETTTLQVAASNKLGFAAKRTMKVAQELYEGMDVGGTRVGLITYMRTDSITVAPPAQAEAREHIAQAYGAEYVPATANTYKAKKQAVKTQEAHECIRPTSVERTPDKVRPYLSEEQYKLYTLIWRRFLASQMSAARFKVRTVTVKAEVDAKTRYGFRTSVETMLFPGWKAAWGITTDEAAAKDAEASVAEGEQEKAEEQIGGRLPIDLVVGEACRLFELFPEQHFTEPPPHYTEATLVKALKDHGIGRPSTYAPTLATIIDTRGYLRRESKALLSTEIGEAVTDFIVERFPETFALDYTAKMETQLDEIAAGQMRAVIMLARFWEPFLERLGGAKEAQSQKILEKLGRPCPECGKELIRRRGRFGPFVSCSGYPACKFIEKKEKAPVVPTGVACPNCGKDIVERRNRRRGTIFYGCVGYPACTWLTNDRPLRDRYCPACEHFLVDRRGRETCPRCEPPPPRRERQAGPTPAVEVSGEPAAPEAPPASAA